MLLGPVSLYSPRGGFVLAPAGELGHTFRIDGVLALGGRDRQLHK